MWHLDYQRCISDVGVVPFKKIEIVEDCLANNPVRSGLVVANGLGLSSSLTKQYHIGIIRVCVQMMRSTDCPKKWRPVHYPDERGMEQPRPRVMSCSLAGKPPLFVGHLNLSSNIRAIDRRPLSRLDLRGC